MTDGLYSAQGDIFESSVLTRGPWNPAHQHGGPPSALIAEEMARCAGDQHQLVRLTVSFLRPVPIAPLRVCVEPIRLGRSVHRYRASLSVDGVAVLEATGLFIKRAQGTTPATSPSPSGWTDPRELAPFHFPFFQTEIGYQTAVDIRIASPAWGGGQVRCWARLRHPLIAGRPMSPEAHVIALADAESGMGPPLDPTQWAFPNADLNVSFGRRPILPDGAYLGLDIRSISGSQGTGLATARLLDSHGMFGQSAQGLVITPIS